MLGYRERLQNLIFEATGTRNVLTLPLNTFKDKSKINFQKVKGSVRLINKRIRDVNESEVFIKQVLQTKLP